MSTPPTTANSTAAGGIGFNGLLALLFIALKLTGVIDWPWLWVLSPIWLTLAFVALIFGGIVGAVLILRWDERRYERKAQRRG